MAATWSTLVAEIEGPVQDQILGRVFLRRSDGSETATLVAILDQDQTGTGLQQRLTGWVPITLGDRQALQAAVADLSGRIREGRQ